MEFSFSVFSVSARRVLVLTREIAQQRGASLIEPEHLILALLKQIPEIVQTCSTNSSVSALVEELESAPSNVSATPSVHIDFAADTREAFRLADAHRHALAKTSVEPVDLLLGVNQTPTGSALLRQMGIDPSLLGPT